MTGLSSCSRKQFSLPHMPVCAQALDNLRLQDGLLQQLRKFRPLSRRGAVLKPKQFRMACHAVFRSVTRGELLSGLWTGWIWATRRG